jgi:ABC-2 type transport system ATP-binding protein
LEWFGERPEPLERILEGLFSILRIGLSIFSAGLPIMLARWRLDLKAIEVDSLRKLYGENRAVDNISFSVEEGEIFGLLGPNGAGKTTAIKMITTLAKPTAGMIRVLGIDALRFPRETRKNLGYVPQALSVDGDLSGYENLLIFSRLFHVKPNERRARIDEALEYMNLTERKNDLAKHYSGGMMRRLEIAQALVNQPRILFLDEPSIGLDPSSRIQVWQYIKRLNKEFGTTVFLTTHDMEEANELCNRLAIMNAGKIAVLGSPEDLKKSAGVDLVTVKVRQGSMIPALPEEIGAVIGSESGVLRIRTSNGEGEIAPIVEFLDRNGVSIDSVTLTRPTLDDVFLKYGGRSLESGSAAEVRSVRRSFARHGGS